MKYIDEFRDPRRARQVLDRIRALVTQRWTIMEVCGGQTHAIVRHGLDQLLPEDVRLLHGPGCPVCVTDTSLIDQAIELAARPGVTLCTFGDMLRVPGTHRDLSAARASGGSVRIIYSPLDAVAFAAAHPDEEVVLLAVGFETTAPAQALAVKQAAQQGLSNFTLLCAQVLVPPALEAILEHPDNTVQGFLAAGHVCAVMGTAAYEPIAAQHRVPIVVTGFEPLDILLGIEDCVRQLEEGRHEVEIQYRRTVDAEGNPAAQDLVAEVFSVVDRPWRGLGEIPASGLGLASGYTQFDANRRHGGLVVLEPGANECIAGEVLLGRKRPPDCPAFGTRCTPSSPLGAPMVSSEGACAAYFQYRTPLAEAS